MSFFDTLCAGETTTRITTDISLIQEGITGNVCVSLTAAATFISALVIVFDVYQNLALLFCSTVIALAVFGTIGIVLPVRSIKKSPHYYSSGANVAEGNHKFTNLLPTRCLLVIKQEPDLQT